MCASLVRIEGKMKIISMCLYSSNSRTSYNTTLAFVKAQFSHLSSSRKKRTEHTHTHTHQRPFKCTWIVHSRFSFAKSRWKFQMMTALKRRTESFILRWQIIFYSYIDQIWFSTLHLFYTHFPLTFFLFSLATLSSF